MNNVVTWLKKRVAVAWESKDALVSGDKRLTYRELYNSANRFAFRAKEAGLKKGDRVILYGKNSIEMAIAIFGVLTFGGVVVCLHPKMSLKNVHYVLANSGATGFIADQPIELTPFSLTLKISLEHNRCTDWETWDELITNFEGSLHSDFTEEVSGDDLAALIYTSGSTGNPKGVMSTHANMVFSTEAINDFLNHTPEDRVLSYLPLAFDYGLYQLFLTLSAGATLFLRNAEDYIADMTDKMIQKEGITGFPGLRSLFSFFTTVKHTPFTTVRYITNTGDALPKGMIERLAYSFNAAEIFLMYGLTECKRVSYLPPKYLQSKPDSVGLPLRDTTVSIRSEQGMECSSGEVGELYVQGAHVCSGYWRDENISAKTFIGDTHSRWLKTGDLFCRDQEGFLYYIGRKDGQFKSSGFRVNPAEIENEILTHFPFLTEAIVVGVPDQMYGHTVGLYAVPEPHALEKLTNEEIIKQIRSFCQEQLEYWKQPKYICINTSVPLTNTQKIDRAAIREIMKKSK